MVRCRRALLVVFLIVVAGCSERSKLKQGPLKVFQVSGSVFVDGQPAAKAQVVFYPAGGSMAGDDWPNGFPQGMVKDDGSFHLTTYQPDDGAPAGDYIVLVQRLVESATGSEEDGDESRLQDEFQGQWFNPEKSTLRATVETKSTEVPRIDLSAAVAR